MSLEQNVLYQESLTNYILGNELTLLGGLFFSYFLSPPILSNKMVNFNWTEMKFGVMP